MVDRSCSEPGCPRPYYSRGVCQAHYMQRWRRGDVVQQRAKNGEPRAAIEAALASHTNDCIEYHFSPHPGDYGCVMVNHHPRKAAVVVCESVHGARPPKMEVCHSCDNSWCINPRHLRWDTHAANMREMAERGRAVGAPGRDVSGRRRVRGRFVA